MSGLTLDDLDVDPDLVLKLKFRPATSLDAERSFSFSLKQILQPVCFTTFQINIVPSRKFVFLR